MLSGGRPLGSSSGRKDHGQVARILVRLLALHGGLVHLHAVIIIVTIRVVVTVAQRWTRVALQLLLGCVGRVERVVEVVVHDRIDLRGRLRKE